jgi:hypothetical protein
MKTAQARQGSSTEDRHISAILTSNANRQPARKGSNHARMCYILEKMGKAPRLPLENRPESGKPSAARTFFPYLSRIFSTQSIQASTERLKWQ